MQNDYFSLAQVLPAILWLLIILVIAHSWKSYRSHDPSYTYFLPGVYYKLGAGIAFALFYTLYYGGGDTVAYYDGAIALNNLFLESPSDYIQEIFANSSDLDYQSPFTSRTGFPPGWIFREQEGYFICKLTSLFSFFTFKSYLAATLILSFITALVSWQLFRLIRTFNLCNEKYIAFAILFIPSLNFWCTGISKDTIMAISIFGFVYHCFKIILPEQKSSIKNLVMILIYAFLIYKVRSFILIAISIPILFALGIRIMKRIGVGTVGVVMILSILFIGMLLAVGSSMLNTSENDFLSSSSFIQEASSIQKDFQQNETYGNKKYDLGLDEFTPTGLLRAMPLAVIYGIYGPLIWDSLSITLILNGLESTIFIYLTFRFFRRSARKKISLVISTEFLLFSLILVFILAFMTGLTSGLWGVLVRLRAPLLPFLAILLSIELIKEKPNKPLDEGSQDQDPLKVS